MERISLPGFQIGKSVGIVLENVGGFPGLEDGRKGKFMGLLKKGKKKRSMARMSARRGAGEISAVRPQYVEKPPPCNTHCPSGNDIRGWLTVIAQREKLGISLDEAMEKAWNLEVETNPFPAIMGRICPHPCEGKRWGRRHQLSGKNNRRLGDRTCPGTFAS
jgi:hypothetical protein